MPVIMYRRRRWSGSDAAASENPNICDGDGNDSEYRRLSSDSVAWSLSALSLRAEPGSISTIRDELLLLSSHGGIRSSSSSSRKDAPWSRSDAEISESCIAFPASSAGYGFDSMASSSNYVSAVDLSKNELGAEDRASASAVMASASTDLKSASTSEKHLPVAMDANLSASNCAAAEDPSAIAMFPAHQSRSESCERRHARACLSTSWSSGFCMLDVVDEDEPWEDTGREDSVSASVSPSSSSSSLLSSMENEDTAEMEVQSSYRNNGETELSASIGASSSSSSYPPLPPPSPAPELPSQRKGLSRFYSGKSRSFSCLGDVGSLKDIVKPENPYAKKRKHNLNGNGSLERPPRLPPLQKGTASISKKTVHNGGKTKLALGVALSSVQDIEMHGSQATSSSGWVQKQQQRMLVSRSYSLSDLQGVAGSHSSV